MKKSTYAEVSAAIDKIDGGQSGSYVPQSRRKVLKVLAEHGWTEDEFIDAATAAFENDQDSES